MPALEHLSGVFGVFNKSSAPTDQFDDTEYTESLYVTQVTVTINGNTQEITNFSSPGTVRKFAEFIAGSINVQLQIQGFYDAAEDAGQEIMFQATIAQATTAATKTWVLWTSTLSGVKEVAGSGFYSNLQLGGQVGQMMTFSATLQFSGTVSEQAG